MNVANRTLRPRPGASFPGRVNRAVLVVVSMVLGSCLKRVEEPMEDATLFVPHLVRTMDEGNPLAESLVVEGGHIVFVGPLTVAEQRYPHARKELVPGVMVPGLVDSHAHVFSLGRSLSIVRLNEATSPDDVVTRLKAAGPQAFQGEWLLGRGWNQNAWPGQAFPTRQTLDAAFGTTPVFLSRVDGHAVWVNTEALKRGGITRDTRDPVGGKILRDAHGEPTGVLVDNAADQLWEKLTPATDAQLESRLEAALARCASLGLTGIHDAGMDLRSFTLLKKKDAAGKVPLRLYVMADGQAGDAEAYLKLGLFEGRHVTMKAVKFLADGALGSRGAALFAPYADDPANTGLLLFADGELEARARKFSDRGFQVAVHAIGDKANALVIDVLSRLPRHRHRVEHAQILRADDVGRFKPNELVASFQPTHATSDMPWAEARLGKERLRYAYAWRSVLDSGAHVAFGSDFPVEGPNPLLGLYAARTRQDAASQPAGGWMPEQRVSGEEALAGFTRGAAWAEFAEARRGMLRVGRDADFVVLTVDPVADPPQALLKAKVLLTVVDGVPVYRAEK